MKKTLRNGINRSVVRVCIQTLEERICLSGFFPITKSVDVGVTPRQLIAVDSNGDGTPDRLMTLNTAQSGEKTATLSVVSVGGGSDPVRKSDITIATVSSGSPPIASDVVSGDFTGDGKLDLALTRTGVSGETSSQIVVIPGDGAGNFTANAALKANKSSFAFFMTSGDYNKGEEANGTGPLDLILADANAGPSLYLGDGQGHFASQPPITFDLLGNGNGAGTSVVISGDVNNDDKLDIIANQFQPSAGTNSLLVFLGTGSATQGNGRGYFTHVAGPSFSTIGSTSGIVNSVILGFFNDDPNADLAITLLGSNVVLVFLGDGMGNFSEVNPNTPIALSAIGSVTPTAGQLVSGDFNGDGRPDLAVIQSEPNGNDTQHPSNPGVSVLISKGDGTFNAPVFTALPAGSLPNDIVAGKFDSDDSDDIAVVDQVFTGTTAKNGRIDVLLTKTGQTQGSSTVVTNTDDSGPGSLRDAINTANSNPGPDTISFNIPGAGVQTITPATPLPALTGPVTIDGYTQPGATPNLVSISDNAHLLIHIAAPGGGLAANALEIRGGSSTVKGLIIDGEWTADISLDTANGNTIVGNFLGVDAAAATATGGAATVGISIASTSANNVIGGTAPADRNIISGNGTGISISSDGNKIQGNFIGTDFAGSHDLGNGVDGITIQNGDKNAIGGKGITAGNIIAFNHKNGVSVVAGTGNPILNNSIFSNRKLGIDLKNNGVTKNDSSDSDKGANNLQNFPVITSAKFSGNKIIIEYSLTSVKGKTYRIEFFATTPAANGSAAQGTFFLGSKDVNIRSGNEVTGTFKVIAPSNTSLSVVTGTATDPSNNTSEFSAARKITGSRVRRWRVL